MANALTHHNSIMAAPYLQVMTPLLCETLGVKLERTVDLGPFKHKVDDGLPLRKAALTCIDTLLCACPERLNMGFFMDIFVPKLVPLLTDKDEIKLQAHQVVLRICALAPATLLTHVETLMEPLEKQLSKKMVAKDKDASGGQSQAPEAERAVDLLRSGVRVVVTISGIEGVSQNRRWQEFVERVSKRESTTELYRTVCQEKSAGEL
jgi:cullin-associated NEDD8-dissociated protein 1